MAGRALQEFEEAKVRQDQQLESIETGLGHLKEIGAAMNEELQRHDILINEVDEKMDKVTKELQTNNMRLKGMVTKVGASAGLSWLFVILVVVEASGPILVGRSRDSGTSGRGGAARLRVGMERPIVGRGRWLGLILLVPCSRPDESAHCLRCMLR